MLVMQPGTASSLGAYRPACWAPHIRRGMTVLARAPGSARRVGCEPKEGYQRYYSLCVTAQAISRLEIYSTITCPYIHG